jgi:hypothetical protein
MDDWRREEFAQCRVPARPCWAIADVARAAGVSRQAAWDWFRKTGTVPTDENVQAYLAWPKRQVRRKPRRAAADVSR